MRAVRLWLAAVLVISACDAAAVPATPSATSSPSPSSTTSIAPTATPSATPRPIPTPVPRQIGDPFEPTPIESPAATLPPMPADLPLRARKERDGILLTIALDRNPMPAGEPTWISVSVQNTGHDEVTWFHDGCADPVGVYARLDARWREGIPLASDPGMFKRYALDLSLDRPGPVPIWISFTPEWAIGRGSVGCADLGIGETLGPGAILKRRLQWNGLANDFLDQPPEGPVRLVATASFFWRTADESPGSVLSRTIEVPLDVWISPGKPAGRLDPPEVIDIALTDPEFAEWFATKVFANATTEWVRYIASEDLWQVGLIEFYVPTEDQATLTYLVIDPERGDIVRRVTRLWDRELDGSP